MKNIFLIAMLFSVTCHAAEKIRPTQNITEMKLQIFWSTPSEIKATRMRYKQRRTQDNKVLHGIKNNSGFAVLLRNKITGEYTCKVWITKPKYNDDNSVVAGAHEILEHCALGHHH